MASHPDNTGTSPDPLETIAAEIDQQLSGEFHRHVGRLDWAAGPPDGLVDNLLGWVGSVRLRREIWRRGQQLWEERAGTVAPELGDSEPPEAPATMMETASAHTPGATVISRPAEPATRPPDDVGSATIVGLPPIAAPTPPATPASERAAGPAIHVVAGPVDVTVVQITAPLATIGRGTACTVTINDSSVAYRQARIVQQGTAWLLEPVSGTGGALLNGTAIGEPTRLTDGAEFSVGPARFRFVATPES
ncbi:MAG: FHA domain-containing protein [Chloroflexota bacterium]